MSEPVRIDDTLWEIPASARADMRVPARVFADQQLLDAIATDRSLEQLQNVATLPGIVGAALAMPDIHQGYGFPVGGLAATAPPDGVVSPGGVGYDINCGVRLLAAFLEELVYLAETQGLVPERVAGFDLEGTRLRATVEGRLGQPPHLVKAVTYHGLELVREGEGWRARVVLDV